MGSSVEVNWGKCRQSGMDGTWLTSRWGGTLPTANLNLVKVKLRVSLFEFLVHVQVAFRRGKDSCNSA